LHEGMRVRFVSMGRVVHAQIRSTSQASSQVILTAPVTLEAGPVMYSANLAWDAGIARFVASGLQQYSSWGYGLLASSFNGLSSQAPGGQVDDSEELQGAGEAIAQLFLDWGDALLPADKPLVEDAIMRISQAAIIDPRYRNTSQDLFLMYMRGWIRKDSLPYNGDTINYVDSQHCPCTLIRLNVNMFALSRIFGGLNTVQRFRTTLPIARILVHEYLHTNDGQRLGENVAYPAELTFLEALFRSYAGNIPMQQEIFDDYWQRITEPEMRDHLQPGFQTAMPLNRP